MLLPAVYVQVEVAPGSPIDRRLLHTAVEKVTYAPRLAGHALLVSTGWSSHWDLDDFVTGGPFFAPDAIGLVVELGLAVLGADFPRFDDPANPTGHLHRFFASPTLLLAPLYELGRLADTAGKLIAAPLRIAGVCASPVRAVWVCSPPVRVATT